MSGPEEPGVILVTGTATVPPEACRLIEEQGFRVRAAADDNLDRGRLHQELADAAGYLIGGYEEPLAEHFEQASRLRVAGFIGTDYRTHVPGWKRAVELGIALVSTPGENAAAVAEFTLLLILALARPFVRQARPGTVSAPAPGMELGGRMLGVIGAGRIGARVARAAVNGFGMRAQYAAPRRNEPLEAGLGITHAGLGDLLKNSDVIALHRPGPRPGEPPLLGRAELERVRPGTLLVNTVHPGLVDPAALLWAIERILAGVLSDRRAAADGGRC